MSKTKFCGWVARSINRQARNWGRAHAPSAVICSCSCKGWHSLDVLSLLELYLLQCPFHPILQRPSLVRPFHLPSSLSVSPAAHPMISSSTKRSLAAMILNRDNSISKSPGGSITSTYVLFVNRARIRLKRGALMAISENGWDAVEEWVYFLSSTLGQPKVQLPDTRQGRGNLRK